MMTSETLHITEFSWSAQICFGNPDPYLMWIVKGSGRTDGAS